MIFKHILKAKSKKTNIKFLTTVKNQHTIYKSVEREIKEHV